MLVLLPYPMATKPDIVGLNTDMPHISNYMAKYKLYESVKVYNSIR